MNNFMQCILAASTVVMTFTNPLLAEETSTVLDQRGVEITVPKEVKRVVAFPGPISSLIYAVTGSTKSIVGAKPSAVIEARDGMLATMSPEILDAKTDFFLEGSRVNMEELLALNPDVIFQWVGTQALDEMEATGLSVIGIAIRGKEKSQQHFEEWLRILGDIYDKKARADQLIALQRQTIAEVDKMIAPIPENERPRVLFIIDTGKGMVKAYGSVNNHHYYWITHSGGKSVIKDLPAGTNHVSMEQILAWDPEVIYLASWGSVTPQDLYENKTEGMDWSQISAVKNRRVFKNPMGVYPWAPPNAERALLMKWAAKRNFPGKFDNIDMNKLVTDFYAEFFDYDLSQAELEKILNFEMNGNL